MTGGEENVSPRTPLDLLRTMGTDGHGRRQQTREGRGSGRGSPPPAFTP